MQPLDHIQTDQLALRPLRKRDFWFFCRLLGDRRVRRYLGGPVSLRRRVQRFRQYLNAPDFVGVWSVDLVERGCTIGLVELAPHKEGKDYEVSYQFCPAFWGNGHAAEAVRAVLSMAFECSDLDRVIAETQSANVASCRLLRGLGLLEVERLHRFGAEQSIFAMSR